jgi:hypothetical protein
MSRGQGSTIVAFAKLLGRLGCTPEIEAQIREAEEV